MKPAHLYPAELFFVRTLFAYCAGIFIAGSFGNSEWVYHAALSTAVALLILIFISVFYRSFEFYNYRTTTGLFCFGFLFCCGNMMILLNKEIYKADHFTNQDYTFLKIRINEDPQQQASTIKFKAQVTKGYKQNGIPSSTSGSLMIRIWIDSTYINSAQANLSFNYGDELIIPAVFKSIQRPKTPGIFDYKSWLAMQNIHHQAFVKSRKIRHLGSNSGNKLIRIALQWRSKQIDYYRQVIKSSEAFGLASTLILGYRADLSDEVLDVYSKTGTIHALSVSGTHVGLIYLIINWTLSFLSKKRGLFIFRFLIIICLIWFYTLITGLSPSVLRSSIMLTVFLIAKTFHKQSNSYNVLAFAAFCLLTYNPLYLWDVGFQLSFLAVLGLVYLQPKLQYSITIKSALVQKLWTLIAISVSAQTATFPLSIYYFHQFPVYFILSNLFIALPLALLMYLGLLLLITRWDFLAVIFEKMILWTNEGLFQIADLPISSFSGLYITKSELVFLSISITLLCIAIAERNKRFLLAGIFSFLIFQGLYCLDQFEVSKQQKRIAFKLKDTQTIAYISGHSALLISEIKLKDQDYRYHIQPALDFHQVRKLKIMKPDTILADK